jgi:hypothetical protein
MRAACAHLSRLSLDQIVRPMAKQVKYINNYNAIDRSREPNETNSAAGYSFPTNSNIFGLVRLA